MRMRVIGSMSRGLRVAAHGDEQGAFEPDERLIGAEAAHAPGRARPRRPRAARRRASRLPSRRRRGRLDRARPWRGRAWRQGPRQTARSSMRRIVTSDCALAISVSTIDPPDAGAAATSAASLASGEGAGKLGHGRDALFGIGRQDAKIADRRGERADGVELGGVGPAVADRGPQIGEGDGGGRGFAPAYSLSMAATSSGSAASSLASRSVSAARSHGHGASPVPSSASARAPILALSSAISLCICCKAEALAASALASAAAILRRAAARPRRSAGRWPRQRRPSRLRWRTGKRP